MMKMPRPPSSAGIGKQVEDAERHRDAGRELQVRRPAEILELRGGAAHPDHAADVLKTVARVRDEIGDADDVADEQGDGSKPGFAAGPAAARRVRTSG